MRTFLLLLALALPLRAYSTNYWIVYDTEGNYALGHSTGGVATLNSVVLAPNSAAKSVVVRGPVWAMLKTFEGVE